MKIIDIQVRHACIPLKLTFRQANSEAPTSSSIIMEVHTKNGCVGLGEACPRSYVTGESPKSVLEECQAIIPQLKGRSIFSFGELKHLILHEIGPKVQNATLCAFDLALLDAFSQERGQGLLDLFEVEAPQSLSYTGVIPMTDPLNIRPVLEAFSFESIKIKVGRDMKKTKERIACIRNIYREEIPIRLDINTSWSYADAVEQIPKYLKMGINTFEQPFMPSGNKDMAFLMKHFGKQAILMADESLTDIRSAFELIAHTACNRFNLKISKHGGIFRSLHIYEIAQMAGVSCQLGAHFGETSILSRAGILLASLAKELVHLEGGFGTHILERDIWERSIKINKQGKIENPRQHFQVRFDTCYSMAS